MGNREVPIPDHIDIFYLTREMPASEKTALQCVMEVDEERMRLEKLAEELVACEDDGILLFYSSILVENLFRCMKTEHRSLMDLSSNNCVEGANLFSY